VDATPAELPFVPGENDVTSDNDERRGSSPDQLIAELETQLREIEAAGGQAPSEIRRQLDRVKRMVAEGKVDGVQFIQAGDASSGLMGFSLPLDSETSKEDPE
jgi:hypothetical protein